MAGIDDIIYISKKASLRHVGVELLRIELCYPSLSYQPTAKSEHLFCESFSKIAELCKAFAKDELFEIAKNDFESCTDSLKRFRFSPLLYSLKISHRQISESIAELSLSASLVRNGILFDEYNERILVRFPELDLISKAPRKKSTT